MKFNGIICTGIAASFIMSACTSEQVPSIPVPGAGDDAIRFSLACVPMGEEASGVPVRAQALAHYDHVEFFVSDASDGGRVKGLKGFYDKETSSVVIEGLREGEYSLQILGIKGDSSADRASICDVSDVSDVWISFPEDLGRPLSAEYFYSSTPFSVGYVPGQGGSEAVADVQGNIVQHRFSRLVGEVNIKEPDVALQAGIGNGSVMVGMLPGPDIGTLRTLLQGTVLFHFGVYQRYVALVRLRLLIQQSKEPVRSGKTHNDHVDLVGHLADGSGKLLRHI